MPTKQHRLSVKLRYYVKLYFVESILSSEQCAWLLWIAEIARKLYEIWRISALETHTHPVLNRIHTQMKHSHKYLNNIFIIYVCIQNISKQNNKYLKSCTLFACATLPPPTLSSYNSTTTPPASPNENVHFVRRFCKSRNKTNNRRWLNKSILIFAKSSQN